MAKVALMLGGNIGDARNVIECAVERINSVIGEVVIKSSDYVTAPWGFDGAEDFVNRAVVADTHLHPEEVLERIHEIETALGRNRELESDVKLQEGKRYVSRVIDIDIILFEGVVMNSGGLNIPHPLMGEREFVLEPLTEIIPDAVHPLSGRTVAEMLAELRISQAVK